VRSNNVVSLDDHRPHISGTAKCMDCGHEWPAVAPIGVCTLECPKCGTMRGTWKFDVSRDEPYWTCNCGNKLFYMTPEGMFCPRCGDWQVGYET
jgi:Zn finger protein HypA/HybF involved in hydrogenase expression